MQGGPNRVQSRLKVGCPVEFEPVRGGAGSRGREDHVGLGHQVGECLPRSPGGAAGFVIRLGRDRGGLGKLVATEAG